ncbi:hypothetical protein FZ934_21400 (plasmid) [Rhizobium grahamii]|uniref:Nodulation protein n=1 Tax=Rhizobium grahamii TaxID=1120045 RepID=A0A5Q0CBV2_9HYPH|nr:MULTISPECIES: hypothetical protein [Rhizobium]QFY62903.1 hypothetical protein FZ934_21400 [Rhizobium grahamii]QRM52346.1 hypothetical protein F3Y33_24255 [Rhizobium sp. BG6]
MNERNEAAGNGRKAAQRGLWRLMLKLPSSRGRLQILAATMPSLHDLFEAYEEASVALENMLKERDRSDCPLIVEYEQLCVDIEDDVIRYMLEKGSGGP